MRAYRHWFFLIQPSQPSEALIDSGPVRYFHSVMGRRHAGLAAFAPQALAEYECCAQIAGTGLSICEDYRTSATIDLVHDRAHVVAGAKLMQLLGPEQGAMGQYFDMLRL